MDVKTMRRIPKSPVIFRIFGSELVPEDVSDKLKIIPSYVHHLGDRLNPRHSGYKHGMWCLVSTLDESMLIAAHLDALLDLLIPKSIYLYDLSQQYDVDFYCTLKQSNQVLLQVPTLSKLSRTSASLQISQNYLDHRVDYDKNSQLGGYREPNNDKFINIGGPPIRFIATLNQEALSNIPSYQQLEQEQYFVMAALNGISERFHTSIQTDDIEHEIAMILKTYNDRSKSLPISTPNSIQLSIFLKKDDLSGGFTLSAKAINLIYTANLILHITIYWV